MKNYTLKIIILLLILSIKSYNSFSNNTLLYETGFEDADISSNLSDADEKSYILNNLKWTVKEGSVKLNTTISGKKCFVGCTPKYETPIITLTSDIIDIIKDTLTCISLNINVLQKNELIISIISNNSSTEIYSGYIPKSQNNTNLKIDNLKVSGQFKISITAQQSTKQGTINYTYIDDIILSGSSFMEAYNITFNDSKVTYANSNYAFAEDNSRGYIISNNNCGFKSKDILNGNCTGTLSIINDIEVFTPNDINGITISEPAEITPFTASISNTGLQSAGNFKLCLLNGIITKSENTSEWIISQDNSYQKVSGFIDANFNPIIVPLYSDITFYPYCSGSSIFLIIPDAGFITDRSNEIEPIAPPLINIGYEFDNNITLELTPTEGSTIYYTLNGVSDCSDKSVKIKITESGNISCYCKKGMLESRIIEKSFNKIDKYVIGIKSGNEFISMSNNLVGKGLTPGTALIIENEAIIKSKNDTWDIISEAGYDKLRSSSGNFLCASTAYVNDLYYDNGFHKWLWCFNQENKEFSYVNSSLSDYYIKYSYSISAFKNYRSSSTTQQTGAMERYKIGGAVINSDETLSNSDVTKLLTNRYIKYVDIRNAVLTENINPAFPGNPNCLLFIKQKNPDIGRNIVYSVNDKLICDSLILTDFEPFDNYTDFTSAYCEYSRLAYKDGYWESIILPFDVNEKDMPENFIFEEFKYFNDSEIIFKGVNSLMANTPYIMRWCAEPSIDKEPIVFKGFNSNITTYNKSLAGNFYGSYKSRASGDDFILVIDSGETKFGKANQTSQVHPFRASLRVNTEIINMHKIKIKHIESELSVNKNQISNDILIIPLYNNSILIKCTEPGMILIYDMSGRLLEKIILNQKETIIRLDKGQYIINNKVVII